MTSMLEPILGSIDVRILYIFAGIMGICLILALIKKVFKVAIFVAAVAAIAIIFAPIATQFQENYKFSLADGAATMKIKGEEFVLDRVGCKEIELENQGMSGYQLRAVTDTGTLDIVIPAFMRDNIKDFAERYGIKIEIRD